MAGSNQRKKNRWRPIDEQRRKERRAAQRNEFRRLRQTLSDLPHDTMKEITTATALQLSQEAENRTAEPGSVCLDTQEDLLTATVVALRLAEKEIKALEDQLNRSGKSAPTRLVKPVALKKEAKRGRKSKAAVKADMPEPSVSPISDIIQCAAPLQQRLLQLKRDPACPPSLAPLSEYDCMFYESESGRAILSSDFTVVDVNDKWIEQLQLVDAPSQWPSATLRSSVLGSKLSISSIFPASIASIISHQFQQSLHSPSNCPSEFSFFSVRKSTLHASAPVYGDLVTVYCWTVPVASPAADASLSPSGRVKRESSSSKSASQPLFYYDCVAFAQPNLCCTNRQILTVLHGDDVPTLARFQSLDFVNVIAETNCQSVREIFDAPDFMPPLSSQPMPTLPPAAAATIGGPDTNFLRILASAAVPSPHGSPDASTHSGPSHAAAYPPAPSEEGVSRSVTPIAIDTDAPAAVKPEGLAPLSCDVSSSACAPNLPTSLSCSSLSSSVTAFSAGPYSSVPSSPASCSTVSRSHNNSPDIRTMSLADRDTHSVISEFSDPYHGSSRHSSMTLPQMVAVKSERPQPSSLPRPVPSAYPRQYAIPAGSHYDYSPMYNMAPYSGHRLPHPKMPGYYADYVMADMTHVPGAVPTAVNGFTVHTATSYSGSHPWSHSVTSAYAYPMAPAPQPMPPGTDDKLMYSGPVPAIVTEYVDDRSDPLLPPFAAQSDADASDRRWYSWPDAL